MDKTLNDLVHDTKLSCRVFRHHTMQDSYIAEVAGKRPTKQEVKWDHIKILGRGSFGLVWLQQCVSKPSQGQLRAVKDILKDPNCRDGRFNYNRELEAIAKFSQERVRSLPTCGKANILVAQPGPSWWIKIADFGISKRTDMTDLYTQVGTQGYMAPELQDFRVSDSHGKEKGTYTLAVDMWSIGVVAFQIFVGHLPFLDRQSFVDYVNRRNQLNFEPSVPSSYIKFIHAAMDPRPCTRLTAKDALMHEWLDRPETDLGNGPGAFIGDQNNPNTGSRDETCSETVKAALPHHSLGGLPSDIQDTQINTGVSGSALKRHHELGTALYWQKKYGDAEVQLRLAVEGRRRTLGEEHQDALSSVYWLGRALYSQKKYDKAEKQFRQAAQGRKRVLDEDHKDTLSSISWLGQALYRQKKYDKAEKPFQQAAQGRKRVLGEQHKDTLNSIHQLGLTLFNQEKYSEAEKQFQRAVQGRKRWLGEHHVDTLDSTHCLGLALYKQEEYSEAKKQLRRAAQGRNRVLGDNHVYTLDSAHCLGLTLYKQEEYSEAEKKLQRVVHCRKRWLSEDHVDTLDSVHCLGLTLYKQEEYSKAEKQLRRAAQGRNRVLGEHHVDTLDSVHCLGLTLFEQEKYSEAKKQFQRAAQGRRQVLGEDHFDTLDSATMAFALQR
ncbi:hypothetical protein MY1884_007773 [Beauveria asiatica]